MSLFAFGNARGWIAAYSYDRRIMRRFVRRHGGRFWSEGKDGPRGTLYTWSVTGQRPEPVAMESA